jgi:DNA segregation ATPase FtsK/SpoIIIE-like protein
MTKRINDPGVSAESPEQETIREFIRANYPKWDDISFQPTAQGSSYITYILNKPLDIMSTVFTAREDDLTAALHLELGDLVITLDAPRNAFLIRRVVKDRVPLLLEDYLKSPQHDYRPVLHTHLEYALGRDPFGEVIMGDLANPVAPHTLVAGTTGSGKTVFLNNTLVQLLLDHSPEILQVLFCDPLSTLGSYYSEIPHLWRPIEFGDDQKVLAHLKELVTEIDRRRNIVAKAQLPDRAAYLKANPDETMPFILLVIDEANRFTNQKNLRDLYLNTVYDLLCNGRKWGIHLILSVQRPSGDALGLGFKDNLQARVVFKLENVDHSTNVLGEGQTVGAHLRGAGDALYRVGSDVTRFQAFWLPSRPTEGQAWLGDYVNQIKQKWGTK